MCDRASYMKMTRGTNLMQQLWFIIINNSTCFGHLYVHLQECRLRTAACGVQHCYLLQCWTPHAAVHNLHSWRWTYRCPKHVELLMIINHNCCIKFVTLVIYTLKLCNTLLFHCNNCTNETQSYVISTLPFLLLPIYLATLSTARIVG